MNWIWNKLLTKDCVTLLIVAIAILLIVAWAVIDSNRRLQTENQRLVDRQATIDRAIIESLHSIYNCLPQPVSYTEVSHE